MTLRWDYLDIKQIAQKALKSYGILRRGRLIPPGSLAFHGAGEWSGEVAAYLQILTQGGSTTAVFDAADE